MIRQRFVKKASLLGSVFLLSVAAYAQQQTITPEMVARWQMDRLHDDRRCDCC